MRVIAFIGYLCFLLLGGSPAFETIAPLTSSENHSTPILIDNQLTTFSNKDHLSVVLEDNESDIEEEHNSNNLKDKADNELSSGNNNNDYCYKASHHVPTKFDHTCGKTSSPVFGNTSPIYIKNRVLRI